MGEGICRYFSMLYFKCQSYVWGQVLLLRAIRRILKLERFVERNGRERFLLEQGLEWLFLGVGGDVLKGQLRL